MVVMATPARVQTNVVLGNVISGEPPWSMDLSMLAPKKRSYNFDMASYELASVDEPGTRDPQIMSSLNACDDIIKSRTKEPDDAFTEAPVDP